MTLIEMGNQNRAKCECCGSTVEYEGPEIEATGRSLAAHFFVECCRCKFKIFLPDLSHSVRIQAQTKLPQEP